MDFTGKRVRVRRHKGGLLLLPENETWKNVFDRVDELGTCGIEAPDDLAPEEIG